MKAKGLLRQLLWIGRSAAGPAEAGRARFWALISATALMALAVGGLVLADSSFDARAERGRERSPRLIAAYPGERPVALLSWQISSFEGLPYDVAYIEPLTTDASPPPGLTRWPEPGEAFLSPALLDAGENHGVEREYGRFGGIIKPEGLEAPAEYFVYARPSAELLDRSKMREIGGFGERTGPGISGEHQHHFSSSDFYAAYGGLVLLPVVLFLVIAARMGAAARDRRTALLTVLGAGRAARACFTTGEAAVPVALGVVLGTLGLLPLFAVDTSYPVVDFVLAAQDARRALPLLAGSMAAVLIAALGLVVLLQPGRSRTRSAGLVAANTRARTWSLWLFPIALLFSVRVVDWAPTDWIVPLYATGYLVVLATLPSVIGWCVGRLGPALAHIGWRTGKPSLLIAGRRIAAGPRAVTRLVAALVIAIGIAVQTQVWTASLSEAGQAAVDSRDRVGTSVLTVGAYATSARVRAFEAALPTSVHALEVRAPANGRGRVEVIGSCPALRELGVSCTGKPTPLSIGGADVRLRESLFGMGAVAEVRVAARTGDISKLPVAKGAPRKLLLIGDGNGQLPLTELSATAHRELAMTASVEQVNSFASTGKLVTATGWLRLLSMVGVAVVFLAAAAGALAEFLRFGRELAPISVLTANHRIYHAAAGWSLLLPAVLAAIAGVLVAWWLAAPIRSVAPTSPSDMAPITVGALVCAVVLAVLGAAVAVRAARSWSPSGD